MESSAILIRSLASVAGTILKFNFLKYQVGGIKSKSYYWSTLSSGTNLV